MWRGPTSLGGFRLGESSTRTTKFRSSPGERSISKLPLTTSDVGNSSSTCLIIDCNNPLRCACFRQESNSDENSKHYCRSLFPLLLTVGPSRSPGLQGSSFTEEVPTQNVRGRTIQNGRSSATSFHRPKRNPRLVRPLLLFSRTGVVTLPLLVSNSREALEARSSSTPPARETGGPESSATSSPSLSAIDTDIKCDRESPRSPASEYLVRLYSGSSPKSSPSSVSSSISISAPSLINLSESFFPWYTSLRIVPAPSRPTANSSDIVALHIQFKPSLASNAGVNAWLLRLASERRDALQQQGSGQEGAGGSCPKLEISTGEPSRIVVTYRDGARRSVVPVELSPEQVSGSSTSTTRRD